MTWWDLAVATALAVAVVFVPGGAITAAIGLRGLAAVALAAPAGMTVIGIAAFSAPLVGLTWRVLPVLLVAVVIVAVALAVRLVWWRSGVGHVPRAGVGAVLALIGAIVLVSAQVVVVIGQPENISQTFDNVFHLNAVRYIEDTGNASPLWISTMTSGGADVRTFYPSGWHALGALVAQLSGASIPVTSNALTILFSAVVWPLGIVMLARTLVGGRTAVLVAAAAASAAFGAFPLLMIEYGVLFPFMAAVAMVPAALAALVSGYLGSSVDGRARVAWTLVILGTLPGILVTHPGAFVALLLGGSIVLGVFVVRAFRARPGRLRNAGIWIAIVVYLGIAGVLWYVLRPDAAARIWPLTETAGQAIGEVLTISVWTGPVNVGMMILVSVGVWRMLRRRDTLSITLLLIFFAFALLYVVVSGLQYPLLRDVLVGAWYNNAPRLAALVPIAWVPLAAAGTVEVWDRVKGWPRLSPRTAVSVAAVLVFVLLVALPQAGPMRNAVAKARALFAVTDSSPLLTSDELALIHRLDAVVPEDAVIAGSPWTGTALAYALADRKVLMYHTLTAVSEDGALINRDLDEAEPGDAVCDAVHRENVQYVLDFGTQEVNGGEHVYPGFDHLGTSHSVELIDREGAAKLYRVVACG